MADLPDTDILPTYDSNTGNIKISSEVKCICGVFTLVPSDKPIKFIADDGIVVPSRTTTERDAIPSPENGAVIFNSTIEQFNFFFDSQWRVFIERPLQDTVISTPFSVVNEDILLVDPGVPVSDIEINLPTSASRFDSNLSQSRPITIRNIHDLNNFRVNINPDGSEEINEVMTIQLKRGRSITLTPDGSNWWSIAT